MEVSKIGDMLFVIKWVLGEETFNIINDYAPQIGLRESVENNFWEDIDELMQGLLESESVFIGGEHTYNEG